MGFIKKIEILSMAFDRDAWITKARQRLEGALGEYAKLRYAKLINFDYDWSDEISALLRKVTELFDPNKTKLKKWKDTSKAFREAYFEASSAHEQLVAAKNQFINQYLNIKDSKPFLIKYKKAGFTSEQLLHDMLTEFSPELLKHLKG